MIKYLFLILFFISTNSFASNNYCTGSLACWPMYLGSGTILPDKSENGNTGAFTSSGHPAWNTTVPTYATSGSPAYSLLYATGDKVGVTPTSNLNTIPGFTLVAWVYPTGDGDSNLGRVMDKSGGGNGWSLSMDGGGVHKLAFSVQFSTSQLLIQTSTALTLNAWTCVVVTWDGSVTATNVHIYFNNAEVTYAVQTSGVGTQKNDSAQSLGLGNSAANNRTWAGRLTEMAIIGRVLNSTERTEIYNYGLGEAIHTNTINNATVNNATIN